MAAVEDVAAVTAAVATAVESMQGDKIGDNRMRESMGENRTHSTPSNARFSAILCLAGGFYALSAAGCSSPNRDYSKVVECSGQPAIRIECEYVGKTPGDPSSFQSSHDYGKINTDFYRITMENLTDGDIAIERVTYRFEKGEVRGAKSASADSIKETWGTNVVPARSSISRANNMVWAKGRRNTFFKTYSFRTVTDGKSEKTFSAEVPLVYIR